MIMSNEIEPQKDDGNKMCRMCRQKPGMQHSKYEFAGNSKGVWMCRECGLLEEAEAEYQDAFFAAGPGNGSSVEKVVVRLLSLPDVEIKSLYVCHDLAGGAIVGEAADGQFEEFELPMGVTHIIIGLGALETAYESGISWIDLAVEK